MFIQYRNLPIATNTNVLFKVGYFTDITVYVISYC